MNVYGLKFLDFCVVNQGLQHKGFAYCGRMAAFDGWVRVGRIALSRERIGKRFRRFAAEWRAEPIAADLGPGAD